MTKTKRQLRADAVERLKAAKEKKENLSYAIVGHAFYPDEAFDAAIMLLTDDELPEGDAVTILRKAAKCTSVNTSVGDVLRYNVPGNGGSAWQTDEDAGEALADMVERDYVRREDYDAEIKAFDRLQDVKQELITERDEWKAKAEKLAERMDKREETMRRLAKLVDVTPEAEYSYNGDPHSVVDGGDFGELATLVFGAVRRLMSERDEWKVKAEQAERAMNAAAGKWAKADAELREGSSKVRAGSSNLEWLYEHDEFFNRFSRWYVTDGAKADDDIQADRWLMEHVAELPASSSSLNGTADGTCPDGIGQASIDTREKLEEDVKGTIDFWGAAYPDARVRMVLSWLDRQAAITASEYCHAEDQLREELERVRAEREVWRKACGEMLDAAHSIERIRSNHEAQSD